MADSSFEKGLTELTKMKVADLKAELKQRGLPTTGNKNELVERLHLAMHDTSLSLDENADEILDEDAVLGDEELETETEELQAKPDSLTVEEPQKRKLPTEENNTPAKKIILNRKSKVEEVKVDTPQKKEENTEKPAEVTDKKVIKIENTSSKLLQFFGQDKDTTGVITFKTENTGSKVSADNGENTEPEKKVIKLSQLSSYERLEMRAKKFGVPLSESAKKEARAARFNISSNNTTTKSAASIKSTPVPASYEVLKKRAERFGTNVSTLLEKAELEAKKEQRKARFGEIKPVEKVTASKIKLVK